LRLSAPVLSARLDGPVTLSTLARLVASGAAVSKADLVQAAGLARTTVSSGVDELLDRGVLRVVATYTSTSTSRKDPTRCSPPSSRNSVRCRREYRAALRHGRW
jgi:hypothetical protein